MMGDERISNLVTCLEAAPGLQRGQKAVQDIGAGKIDAIRSGWGKVCEDAASSEIERNLFGQRVFLDSFIFDGAPEVIFAGRIT